MCRLLETIRIIDGVPRNLSFHEERMKRSRRVLYGKTNLLKLSDYINIPEKPESRILKCRIVYGSTIDTVEFSPYTPADIRTLRTVMADTLVYDHKYSDRSQLTAFIDKRVADDILIVKNRCVTDASYANIAFTDGKKWTTPDTPLLYGTMRESLLRSGAIEEAKVTIDNLMNFSHFRLINAMLGFEAPVLPISNLILNDRE
jgi:4-amino-4-deoxychorismate lyase